uniref:Uncharacterized protein n=1 Tax=Eutreptiella gymnastica TaxID=73025 RepID=A0A7S4FSD0_9EUGL
MAPHDNTIGPPSQRFSLRLWSLKQMTIGCIAEGKEKTIVQEGWVAGCSGAARKAERVCWLALSGSQTYSSLEKGVLHLWIGGLGAHPLGRAWLDVKRVGQKETPVRGWQLAWLLLTAASN